LCCGVVSAPGLFQNEMEKIFIDVEGILIFFDDILFYDNEMEHANR